MTGRSTAWKRRSTTGCWPAACGFWCRPKTSKLPRPRWRRNPPKSQPTRAGRVPERRGHAMRTVAHISDLHFGRIDHRVVEALVEDLEEQKPSLAIISGDLTQ